MEHDDRLTPASSATGKGSARENPRRCILTGEAAPRTGLIRLALGPDGSIAADLGGKLPGRGAWISADRSLFTSVAGRGRLKGALARALRTNAFALPDDLAARIEAGLAARLLGRLGLENRAGTLIHGSDRVREALRSGRVFLLLHAGDARPDGADRLDGMARAIGESVGEPIPHHRLPFSRDVLSAALGRDNVVHAALIDGSAAGRILADLHRLIGFSAGEPSIAGPGDATEVAANARERH